jgi:glycosyltransferase involved in cell wall biosynthesis
MAEPLDCIRRPYLLVIHIPVYVDAAGTRWVDDLWHKDLVRHLSYLGRFSLACPHIFETPPAGYRSLDGYPINYIPLPRQGGRLRNALSAPACAIALWKAIAHADIVHSGVGNWSPLTLGNLTFVISRLRKKFRLIIVESSTWRVLPTTSASIARRWSARLSELVNQACVSTADLSVFTQAQYQRTLLKWNYDRGHVIHASWVDDSSILDEATVRKCWEGKRAQGPVRYLFAGRLAASKGLRILLQALRILDREGIELCVDIMGRGELEAECASLVSEAKGSALRVRLLQPVEYGDPFFSVMRDYSAVIVPSVGDEQPRIVYDAYSQGIPVLASATPGLLDCVVEGETGRLFSPNSSQELAACMRWGTEHTAELEQMGLRGLERARSLTHGEMHRQRFHLLVRSLNDHFAKGGRETTGIACDGGGRRPRRNSAS